MSGGTAWGSGPLVGLLGPVQLLAADGTAVPLPPALAVLLAMLALSVNRVVPAEALVSAIWPEDPSRDRERNLHARVYQLRRLLAAAEPGRTGDRLQTRPPGYRLTLSAGELDVTVFTGLAGRGRDAARAGDAVAASQLMGEALAMWRGQALADVLAISPRLEAEAHALEERRLATLEDRVDADLGCGRHGELAAELTGLTAAYPLRERLRSQLMIALYRSGRQAHALEAYQQTRLQLAEQLGIDPGPELRALHQRILQSDPALTWTAPAIPLPDPPALGPDDSGSDMAAGGRAGSGLAGATAPVVVPRQLPAGPRSFAGRQAELKTLSNLVQLGAGQGGTVVITAIGGTAGIGKTALALHWAHSVADQFPDGQLFVNLRGYDPSGVPVTPEAAVRGFLDALGVPVEQTPASPEAQAGLYRSLLASRRTLILLDNARDAAQVRPLLPASPASLVLVTSRSALAGLVAADGAIPVPLDLVSRDEAEGILARRLGPERLAAEPEAAGRLIGLCARLPLALAITAARAAAQPGISLTMLAGAMADERGRLDELDTGEVATSVRAVFSWSYGQLGDAAARMFRLLGVHSGPDISAAAAASLGAFPASQARQALAELGTVGLLTQHVPGRYAFHDLLRAYAAEQAAAIDGEAERRAAVRRVLDYYVHTAAPACLLLGAIWDPIELDQAEAGTAAETITGREQASAWFQAEHQALLAAVAQAASYRMDAHAWQLAWALRNYLLLRCYLPDFAAVTQIALGAAEREGDPVGLGWTHHRLGVIADLSDAPEQSVTHQSAAITHFERAGRPYGQAAAHMGITTAYHALGQLATALDHAEKAIGLYREARDDSGVAYAMSAAADMLVRLGKPALASEYARQAVTIGEAAADQNGLASALMRLGEAHSAMGDHIQAEACLLRAIAAFDRDGNGPRHAECLIMLGDIYDTAGKPRAAVDAWRRGLQQRGNDILRKESRRVRARIEQIEAEDPSSP